MATFRPSGPHLFGSLALSGVAVAMTWRDPGVVQASPWRTTGDGGLFIGLRFGNPRRPVAATMGLEVHGVLIDSAFTCDGHTQDYGGAVARVELIGWENVRLTLGPVVGTTDGAWGYAGEATAGFERGTAPGAVFQVAAEVNGLFLFNTRLGYAFGRDGQVTVGARTPLSTSAACVTGRPLRRNDQRAPVAGAQWAAPSRDRASDERAAGIWMERACLEWASVPAFCELARQLQASGAPAALVTRARDAAADELRHAALSAQVAAGLAGAPTLALDPPVDSDRPVASGRAGIVRLAVESYLDGCLGEGTAAAVAAEEAKQAELCGDDDLARLQRSIAGDEARHAELAWDILDWTARVHPQVTRAALILARETGAAVQGPRGPVEAGATLQRLGILASSRVHAIARETRARAELRLAPRLAA